jgi:hypothetical protein
MQNAHPPPPSNSTVQQGTHRAPSQVCRAMSTVASFTRAKWQKHPDVSHRRPVWKGRSIHTYHEAIKRMRWGQRCSSVVENVLSIHEALAPK